LGKIYFKYGTMGSSKTANALMTKYNFEEKGRHVLLLNPHINDRDGKNIVKSRIGLESVANGIPEMKYYEYGWFMDLLDGDWVDDIIIDECQFLTKYQVDELVDCVQKYNVSVWCYGLKTDFKGLLFEGSKRLIEFADSIEEIKTSCWCGKKAIMNARIIDGRVVKDGPQVVLGGNESYTALCRGHWISGDITGDSIFKKSVIKNTDNVDFTIN